MGHFVNLLTIVVPRYDMFYQALCNVQGTPRCQDNFVYPISPRSLTEALRKQCEIVALILGSSSDSVLSKSPS